MFVLQMAKQNVENHYSVVGLTERLEDTLILFEAYLPRFFKVNNKSKKRIRS